MQHKEPKDFVIATKTSHSVKDFINICSKKLNIKLIWKNRGLKEIGIELGFKQIMTIEKEKRMNKVNNSSLEIARQDHAGILSRMKK